MVQAAMTGMSRQTGRACADEIEHIRQSIRDILTTPIGSRVKRRRYGSLLPDLIDHPGNASNRLRLMSATVMAIIQWEPRVKVKSAALTDIGMDGAFAIELSGVRSSGQRSGYAFNVSIPL